MPLTLAQFLKEKEEESGGFGGIDLTPAKDSPPSLTEFLDSKGFASEIRPTTPADKVRIHESQPLIERLRKGSGLDFNTERGLTGLDRLKYSNLPSNEDKLDFLTNKFGSNNVEIREGQFVIRDKKEGSNQMEEFLPDEFALTGGDILDAAGPTLDLGVGLASAIVLPNKLQAAASAGRLGQRLSQLGKGLQTGLGRFGTTSLASTAGFEGSGAIRAGAAQIASPGNDLDIGQLSQRALTGASANTLMDLALLGVVGTGRLALAPFRSRLRSLEPEIQKQGQEALENLRKAGFDVSAVRLTPAQETGSVALHERQQFIQSALPGSAITRMENATDDAIRVIQRDYINGYKTTFDSPEALRNASIKRIETRIGSMEEGAREANIKLHNEIRQDIIDQMPKPATTMPLRGRMDIVDVGQAIKKEFGDALEVVKTKSKELYSAFDDEVVKLGGINTDPSGVIRRMKEITRDFPKAGEQGQYEAVVNAFVPQKFQNLFLGLEKVAKGKGAGIPIQEARMIRTRINDAINFGEPVGNLDQGFLKQFSKEMDKSINSTLGFERNKFAKELLKKADDNYKATVLPFNRSGIKELFKQETDAGFIFNEDVVRRMAGGQGDITRWRYYKETLGEDSAALQNLRAKIAERWFAPALTGSEVVDGKTIMGVFDNIKDKELLGEIFGVGAPQKIANIKKIGALSTINASMDKQDFEKIMLAASPSDAAGLAREAVLKRQRVIRLYDNEIIKGLKHGTLDERMIDPKQFVRNFVNTSSTRELKEVMELIKDPDILTGIARETMSDFFVRAASKLNKVDRLAISRGDSGALLNPNAALRLLEKEREHMKIILGNQNFKILESLIDIQLQRSLPEGVSISGGLVARQQVAGKSFSIENLFAWPIKFYYGIWAGLLTNPATKRTATAMAASQGSFGITPNVARFITFNSDAMTAVVDAIGDDPQAGELIRQLALFVKPFDEEIDDEALRQALPSQPAPAPQQQQQLPNGVAGPPLPFQ